MTRKATDTQGHLGPLVVQSGGVGVGGLWNLEATVKTTMEETRSPAETAEDSKAAEESRTRSETRCLPTPPLSVVVQAAMLQRACSGIRTGSCA